MYPKQPFDFAGRTGTVAFDVSDNTQGTHAAWPEFWMSDQPVPAPFTHLGTFENTPRNGFGVRFGAFCPPNQGCGAPCPFSTTSGYVTVDSAVIVRNYEAFDTAAGSGGTLQVHMLRCVKASTGPGQMNHFELRISQNEIDVYGTDAGTTGPLVEIATITNADLTLTRGLIWLEDVHYNGDKFGTQGNNTFTWDNVGFDGPILPRDLAFDAMDSLTRSGFMSEDAGPMIDLGWNVPSDGTTLPGTSVTVSVPGVYNIARASGGLLTFNYYTHYTGTMKYQLNGHGWHTLPWPYPDQTTYTLRAIAVPIALSEVVAGTNAIQFDWQDAPGAPSGAFAELANVDLIMVGAGGLVPPAS
jgi:hypothetical protein